MSELSPDQLDQLIRFSCLDAQASFEPLVAFGLWLKDCLQISVDNIPTVFHIDQLTLTEEVKNWESLFTKILLYADYSTLTSVARLLEAMHFELMDYAGKSEFNWFQLPHLSRLVSDMPQPTWSQSIAEEKRLFLAHQWQQCVTTAENLEQKRLAYPDFLDIFQDDQFNRLREQFNQTILPIQRNLLNLPTGYTENDLTFTVLTENSFLDWVNKKWEPRLPLIYFVMAGKVKETTVCDLSAFVPNTYLILKGAI